MMRLPFLRLLALLPLALSQTTSPTSSLPSSTSPPTLTAVISTLSPSPLPSTYTGPTTNLTGTPTTFVFTLLPTTTLNSTAANATATNGTAAEQGPVLNPIGIDPTYGVLGALLLVLHIPLLLLGPKLRLYTPLLLTSHLLSLTTLILILHFGVEPNISLHPPNSELRGLYFLACIIAGAVGAGVAALWREYAEWGCGAVAGFAVACWVEALHSGGVVQGEWRWLLFVGCAVGGFVLCTVRRLKVAMLVGSSAVVGASGVMLGIDCFTAVGLKEFYIANLGFTDLFPQLPPGPIPLTQPVTVELSLLAALALISLAIQLRVVPLLKARRERMAELRLLAEREKEEEKARLGLEEEYLRREREEWEAKHGKNATWTPEMKDSSPPDRPSSQFELLGSTYLPYAGRTSGQSPLLGDDIGPEQAHRRSGDYISAPTPLLPGKPRDRTQSQGPLPTLDLGGGLLGGLASHTTVQGGKGGSDNTSLTPPSASPSPRPASRASTVDAVRDLQEKMALLDEIRSIRLEIGKVRSETRSEDARAAVDATGSGGVGEVLTRARTLSANLDLPAAPAPAKRAPPPGPGAGTGTGMGAEWEAYIKQRRLLVPGTPALPASASTPAMPPSPPAPAPRPPVDRIRTSEGVKEALEGRWQRESMMELGVLSATGGRPGWDEQRRRASAYDIPLIRDGARSPSLNVHGGLGLGIVSPVPERRVVPSPRGELSPNPAQQQQQQEQQRHQPRTMTTGQLDARHREVLRGMQAPVKERLEKDAQRSAPSAKPSPNPASPRPREREHRGERPPEARRKSTGDLDRMAEGGPPRRERREGREREREVPFPKAAERPPRAKRYPS